MRGEFEIKSIMLGTKVKSMYCIFSHIHKLLWYKIILKKFFEYGKFLYMLLVCWPQSVYTRAHSCETCLLFCVFLYIQIVVSVSSLLTEKAGQHFRTYSPCPSHFCPWCMHWHKYDITYVDILASLTESVIWVKIQDEPDEFGDML